MPVPPAGRAALFRAVLFILPVLAAAPAAAQDRPLLIPTRDVAVTYRFTGPAAQQPGLPQGLSFAWQAATGLMRSDIPGMGWMVADQRGGRGFMVMEGMRMIMDVPLGQAMSQQGPSPNATFRREGAATVAGHACTVWGFQDGPNQGRACITGDGVLLRSEGTWQGRSGGMEATQVTYGPQDPARFQRPQGYQTMQAPAGMPGGMPPRAPPPGR